MARFFTLASGSSGNSAYIGSSDAGVLVDVGISCKGILNGLNSGGIAPEQVEAIFITHEHIDHVRGLRVLLKKLPVPICASEDVLAYLVCQDSIPAGVQVVPIKDSPVQVAGMEITCFNTSHDSVHSLGYRIHTADDRLIGVTGDLGYISSEVRQGIAGCDLILIESNYEPTMLMNGAYPYHLKKRISSNFGHLSNEACATLLPELVRTGTTRFVLAHLSRENNLPELAYQTSLAGLNGEQMEQNTDFVLTVAPRSNAGEMLIL